MNVLSRAQAIVLKEIASLGDTAETAAAGSEWWNGLSKVEKRQYILSHPKSKYAQSSGGQSMLTRHGARASRNIHRKNKMIDRRTARVGKLQERHATLTERAKSLGRGHPSQPKIKARLARINKKIAFHGKVIDKHKEAIKGHHKVLKSAVSGLGKLGAQIKKHHDAGRIVRYRNGKMSFDMGGGRAGQKPRSGPKGSQSPSFRLTDDKKPSAKAPAKKKGAPAPAPKTMPGKKGSLHEHLGVPHGTKLPHAKLMKLAKSDHPLAGRARQALRFRGVKGDLGEKKAAEPKVAPAAKAPAKKPKRRPVANDVVDALVDNVHKTAKMPSEDHSAYTKRMAKMGYAVGPEKKPARPKPKVSDADIDNMADDIIKSAKMGGASKLKRAEW